MGLFDSEITFTPLDEVRVLDLEGLAKYIWSLPILPLTHPRADIEEPEPKADNLNKLFKEE